MIIPDYHGVLIPLRNRVLGQRKKNREAKAKRAAELRRLEHEYRKNRQTL